ncbi:MAG: hypothetical protein MI739_12100 [Bacteroidales bacterium]|nr:hypothetical protein [Bacteroidales bacterium]
MKKTVPYVYEFFVVLLGVYLAFVLTNWHEQQKINKEIKQIYNEINEEIFNNYQEVYSLNKKTRNSFTKLLKYENKETRREMKNLFSITSEIGGIYFTKFKYSAFNKLNKMNISNQIPRDYIIKIEKFYASIKNIEEIYTKSNDVFFSSMTIDNKQIDVAFAQLMLMLWQQQSWCFCSEEIFNSFSKEYPDIYLEKIQHDSIINKHFRNLKEKYNHNFNTYIHNKRIPSSRLITCP